MNGVTTRRLAGALVTVWGVLCIPGASCAQGTAPEPTKEERPAQGQDGAREFATADQLLGALETADKGMTSLVADLLYEKTLVTVGDRQTRKGKLYFQNPGASGGRRFAIEFNETVIGRRQDTSPELYVFDGQWLLEKNDKDKRYTKRQVVPPGQSFDPLKIGEGPFPIPIGQKREDILARYTVELLKPEDGLDAGSAAQKPLVTFVAGSYQLRLVPRPDRPDQDRFKEIRLWYRADKDGRLLPRMARTIAAGAEPGEDGDVSVVRLMNVEVNGRIPQGVIDTSTPPASEGWDGSVMDFREPGGK